MKGNSHLDAIATLKVGDKVKSVTSILIFNDSAKGQVRYVVDLEEPVKAVKGAKLILTYGKVKKEYNL